MNTLFLSRRTLKARLPAMLGCIALQVCVSAQASSPPPSTLVPNRAMIASIKFSVRLASEAELKACREWMGRMFGEVKETRETIQPGNAVTLTIAAEKHFHPPFKEADALHAAFPSSPCGKGVLGLSVTQQQSADDARRGQRAL